MRRALLKRRRPFPPYILESGFCRSRDAYRTMQQSKQCAGPRSSSTGPCKMPSTLTAVLESVFWSRDTALQCGGPRSSSAGPSKMSSILPSPSSPSPLSLPLTSLPSVPKMKVRRFCTRPDPRYITVRTYIHMEGRFEPTGVCPVFNVGRRFRL